MIYLTVARTPKTISCSSTMLLNLSNSAALWSARDCWVASLCPISLSLLANSYLLESRVDPSRLAIPANLAASALAWVRNEASSAVSSAHDSLAAS